MNDPVEIQERPRRLTDTKITVAPFDQGLEVARVLLDDAVERGNRFLVAPALVKLEALACAPM